MGRGPRVRSESGIYHVILRGANRQEIFHDDQDCDEVSHHYFKIQNECNGYVSMRGVSWETTCISSSKRARKIFLCTMKRLGISFVRYYNDKYEATGHLFFKIGSEVNL